MQMDSIEQFLSHVKDIGHARSPENLPRRLAKVFEELGEVTEAILNVTCPLNYKNKTNLDIVEEAVDCIIVLVDCFYTDLPYPKEHPTKNSPFEAQFAKWIEGSLRSGASGIHESYYETIGTAGISVGQAMSVAYRDEMQFKVSLAIIDMIAVINVTVDLDSERLFLETAGKKLDKWVKFLEMKNKGVVA